MKSRKVLALAATAALVGMNLASDAFAEFKNWNVGSGIWGLSGSWSPTGVPTSSDIASLDRLVGGDRGRATVSGTGFVVTSVRIRQSNELNIANHSSLVVGGDISVGYGSSTGFVNVNSSQPGVIFFDGSLTTGNSMRLGTESSFGLVAQNDGTVTVNNTLRVGDRHATNPIFPGTGRYNLSGFGVLNATRLEIGYGGAQNQFACEGEFNLSGNATLNIGSQIPDPHIGGGGGTGTLNQTGGTLNSTTRVISLGGLTGPGTFNHSAGACNLAGISLENTGVINYTGGGSLTVGQLSTVNGRVNMGPGGGKTLRATLLFTSPGTWGIDVNDNSMVTLATFGETVLSAVIRGRNGGAWNGNAITSSAARNNAQHTTTLGVLSGAEYRSVYGTSATFNGVAVTDAQSLVKYTLNGDTDLNGIVDFDDYSRIDAGFNNHRTGWLNGDFDYNNVVDFDDYSLIDQAFNTQNRVLSAVPEPATGALITCAMGIGGLRRTLRRSGVQRA